MSKQVMDGCTAAAHVAYALSEVATIYPITPIASMGETADRWAMAGRKNIFGSKMAIKEMESELGAAGATHGALAAGALATTFTSSQGLMLMIPNMYKIAGELLPGVFHVGTRSLATQALSIFGDHQDVMACRATGFAFIASASVQETMDLALVSHLAAIEGSIPVVHFFDGWRTSNEMSTIDVIDYDAMARIVDMDKVAEFRRRAMNPEHPDLRGSAQNSDVYFQNREAANNLYDAFPAVVSRAMDKVATITGRQYHLVDYSGAPDATDVIVAMGSSTDVCESAIADLNSKGYKAGVVKVRLYRPFPLEQFLKAIPPTVKRIAVLDRTKEAGSAGEPLFLDVSMAVQQSGRQIMIFGGRYGLGSKEFNPTMVKAVIDNMTAGNPKRRFTVGITDDVSHLSLLCDDQHFVAVPADVVQSIFYGLGSDGTVGSTKQIASILTDVAGLWSQAYFNYSAKKSGGYTISELRYAPHPIEAAWSITDADYVGCNKDSYCNRFDMLDKVKEGTVFTLNTSWTAEEIATKLPDEMKRTLARKHMRMYIVDARSIAEAHGLGVRINTIMATVFLHLSTDPTLAAKLIDAYKQTVSATYMHEGGVVVKNNLAAIDDSIAGIVEVTVDPSWADAPDNQQPDDRLKGAPEFITKVANPCMRLEGDDLPVSVFNPDGVMPMGTTAWEKRTIADRIPHWTAEKCVQCTQCSLVCAHAAIRPYLLTDVELAKAPAGITSVPSYAPALKGLHYRIQVYPQDCTGCGSCAVVCPGHALDMVPIAQDLQEQKQLLSFVQQNVSIKDTLMPRTNVIGSQLQQPLLQFSGACAGCGETPYVKLLTQLMGERLLIANATGCSSIWGANYPSNAYCTRADGRGPAWGNSLFEDNAEYGFGMLCALNNQRGRLLDAARTLAADPTDASLQQAAQAWIEAADDPEASRTTGEALLKTIGDNPTSTEAKTIVAGADLLAKKSVWAIGGDGWAYDIGFAGLDHVLAQDEDINILVMDTECYSNTGGQTSKATPLGAVMKYAADGKRTHKKDLGRMMMTYGNVYVASIALGANYQQAIDALTEAEAYHGPSIVIAYCPCINHGIRSGMSHSIVEERLAVHAGYWSLYRYDPSLLAQGKDPLTVDCEAPDGTLPTFLSGEDRYADLRMIDPKEADILQPELAQRTSQIYSIITSRAKSKLF
ncbi:MAG: pyruvate:ferredoxin (flavodoxin) oxidoreductase [Bacteroides sp.]|nr:pyruvate:ferredoxin (flavodoxin) oxidoreductase [Bacteroides sp.]MCM1413899.1 pyruvate:ferredoxin (flavodoxin) oxidoreductase [Bacteroides sp.]